MSALVDLHVHSIASPCSTLTAEEIARDVQESGVDAVAVVDHGRFPEPSFIAALHRLGVPAFVGLEITCIHGDVLVYGVSDIPPEGLGGPEVAHWVWERGGMAVAAHPFRRLRPAGARLLDHPLLAVEVLNGRCTPDENERSLEFADRFGRTKTGGSDAHARGEVGSAATRFERLPESSLDLASILRTRSAAPWSPVLARTG